MAEPHSTKRRAVARQGAEGPMPAPAPASEGEVQARTGAPGLGAGTSLASAASALSTAAAVPPFAIAPASSSSSLASASMPAPPTGADSASAASMLRAAEALAAEASASPAALHALALGVREQAQRTGEALAAQAQARADAQAASAQTDGIQPGSSVSASAQSAAGAAAPPAQAQAPGAASASGLLDYSSSMTAQLTQAIARQHALSAAASSSGAAPGRSALASSVGTSAGGAPSASASSASAAAAAAAAVAVARAEMTDIAVRAAAQEAQAQGMVQEMMMQRSRSAQSAQSMDTSSTVPGQASGGGAAAGDAEQPKEGTESLAQAQAQNAGAPETTAAGSASPEVATSSLRRTSVADRGRRSSSSAASDGRRSRRSSSALHGAGAGGIAAADAYLATLGLAHVRVPLVAPAATSFASSSTMPQDLTVSVPGSVAAAAAAARPFSTAHAFSVAHEPHARDSPAAAAATSPRAQPPASSASAAASALFQQQLERFNNGSGSGSSGRGSASAGGSGAQRRWDESDPVADLKLGGVPSMPLMPAPALQMLPPPDSPAFLLEHFARAARAQGRPPPPPVPRSSSAAAAVASQGDAPAPTAAPAGMVAAGAGADSDTAASAAPSASSLLSLGGQFPFQVVQTPGGTARPGWWIPNEALGASSAPADADASTSANTDAGTESNEPERARTQSSKTGGASFQPRWNESFRWGSAKLSKQQEARITHQRRVLPAEQVDRPVSDEQDAASISRKRCQEGELPRRHLRAYRAVLTQQRLLSCAIMRGAFRKVLRKLATGWKQMRSASSMERRTDAADLEDAKPSDTSAAEVEAMMVGRCCSPRSSFDAETKLDGADDLIDPPSTLTAMTEPPADDYDSDLDLYEPSYRTFTSEEFAALASAAAIATAALTTKRRTSTAGLDGVDPSMAAEAEEQTEWAPLSPHQQEQIAAQLRAWAGLEGPERQAQARRALEDRKVQVLEEAKTDAGALTADGADGADASIEQVPPSAFFPPDFASHYQAQLQALAEGYYERLHKEDLSRSHFAAAVPSSTAADSIRRRSSLNKVADGTAAPEDGSIKMVPARKRSVRDLSPAPPIRTQPPSSEERAKNEQLIRDAVQGQNDARYGMPGPAYGTANQIAQLPPGQDPMQLIAAASGAAGVDVRSPLARDQLLQFAHNLYSTGSTTVEAPMGPDGRRTGRTVTQLHPTLLPLLHTLHGLHPEHLPTLLLLSCAYYTAGDLPGSLWYNNLILRLDPQYVEAMSNIGTTLRALGRWREAESWWWRAIRLRPGYWDAYENLLGVLCSPRQVDPSSTEGQKTQPYQNGSAGVAESLPAHDLAAVEPKSSITGPRFAEALQLCEFVERHILGAQAQAQGQIHAGPARVPIGCPVSLPAAQIPRLQNLYYGKGNLKYVLPELGPVPAAAEYEHAIEVVISPHPGQTYSVRDLIVAVCVVSVLSLGVEIPGFPGTAAAFQIADALGLNLGDRQQASFVASGAFAALCPGGILALVRNAGDALVRLLLQLGGGHLPMFLLLPAPALQLVKIIFSETNGSPPSLAMPVPGRRSGEPNAIASAVHQTCMTSSTVLLTLAKLYQDATASPAAGPHGLLTLGGIPPSTSLLLPLYYMSLSLHASASTCNNLGILLSSIPAVATVLDTTGQSQQINGQSLAMQYYSHGLQLDTHHPHLYTNLGSLLKDLGHLSEAIKMYEKAVACNPKFDVALANLGNAIKDQGRTQDSVTYYRRAVEVNPNFPEALCGLVNALLAICDWREVYELSPPLMTRVSELVSKQLTDGCHYGAGTMHLDRPLQAWLEIIAAATGDWRRETQAVWAERLAAFYTSIEQRDRTLCEGSFVIRLVEKLTRKMQRRWYLDVAAQSTAAGAALRPFTGDAARYPRPMLPGRMIPPAVPTVLPFHTFTYPLSTRQIRLISHRNALRISQTTLSQMWLPPHVYPPPPVPAPTLKIGYISSDFNNHPLAHLMQSCFGFHDRSRFGVYLYATTPSDQSPFRQKIESEAQHFLDVSTWKNEQIIDRIISDGIHILINLNGYTKGARNEIFAARPCPVQMEFMGFAGPLVSGWTDWVIADPIVCPPSYTSGDAWRRTVGLQAGATANGSSSRALLPTDLDGDLDPESHREDWLYSERFIYMPHSYFVNDHKQGFREESAQEADQTPEERWRIEEHKRWTARKELFPNLPDDYLIFTDFNQLYKCEPSLFRLWLRILSRAPKSILWLLRFPASGEPHLLAFARQCAGDEVASRIVFTDVAPKHVHIQRGRIADLFLDTTECNAHTTAADILWSGTPVLTWPKHMNKMCSRVAASIVKATGLEAQLVVSSEQAYEDRAVQLAQSLQYDYVDRNGTILAPVQPPTDTITADALAVNTAASSAVPHGGTQADTTAAPASVPEAPVSKAAVGTSAAQATAKAVAAQVTAPSSSIELPRGLQAPPGAVSRHGKGELSDLRRHLFLTREQSPLFDTRAWVRALERGYEEAWRRWVAGTDSEDSPEWQALPIDAPEKISAHIWLHPE